MPGWTIIPAESLAVSPWRNGLGVSRNIATRLHPDGTLLWQVGIAELERDLPFSHYPHCDRVFTPIAGDPPALAFHDCGFETCPLLVPRKFSGEWPTRARIPGPGRAFNAIVDRRHRTATVAVRSLGRHAPIELPEMPDVVIHCLSGAVDLTDGALGPSDSALGGGSVRAIMAMAGVVIVVGIGQAGSSVSASRPGD